MTTMNAPALALACLLSSTLAAAGMQDSIDLCQATNKGGLPGSIFIAQQGGPIDQKMDMYGVVRTDAFLIAGRFYYAGSVEGHSGVYDMNSFLSATHEMLTDELNTFVSNVFPGQYEQAIDPDTGVLYYYLPPEIFQGLAIMDIEGEALEVHPDSLLDHYRYTTWNGYSGMELVDRFMEQYGMCADVTKRAFPGGNVGLFGVVRGRRNGTSSDEYVRKVNLFKQKAADPRNWLRNVDYLCPAIFSAWAPKDEATSCQPNGSTIVSCAARYLGSAQVTVEAFTRGPLVDFDTCGGDENDPDSGCAIRRPDDWYKIDPVRDVNGNAFRICPLISVQIMNGLSCAHDRFAVEPGIDPTLESTIGVSTGYLNDLVFNSAGCIVDCYAYWTPVLDFPFLPTRDTLTALPWPMLGDYNGNGQVGLGDNAAFTFHFWNADLRADLNGDDIVDRYDRMIMDTLLGLP